MAFIDGLGVMEFHGSLFDSKKGEAALFYP